MQKMIFLLCAVALGAIAQAKPLEKPKLSIYKNNIKVWTYQNEQNPVFLYKAETTYTTPIENAVSLILNVEHTVQWVPYMGSIKGKHPANTALPSDPISLNLVPT